MEVTASITATNIRKHYCSIADYCEFSRMHHFLTPVQVDFHENKPTSRMEILIPSPRKSMKWIVLTDKPKILRLGLLLLFFWIIMIANKKAATEIALVRKPAILSAILKLHLLLIQVRVVKVWNLGNEMATPVPGPF